MPAVPSSPPLTTPSPSAGPADDLFRPSPSAGMPAPARPGVMLQRSTPIFDDVATAWFHENEAVPMRWTAVDPPADPPVDSPPGSSSQLAGESIAAAAQADPVGSAAAATDPAAKSPREDRGAGDKGWQTAQALASPAPGAEVTAAGLPRRKPRALLMSGAVGGSAPADPGNAPARSAERIRGRLASYQQGLRDGRHVRRHQDQHASGSHHQQDAEEEKQ